MDMEKKKELQLVYVLTSTENDIYLEQAYVSMCSARRYNPNAVITLLTDELTAATFTGVRKDEVRYADNIVVVKTPENLNGQRRSRILKTSARKHVKGDFLFIDCDTIVAKPLDDVLNVDAEIAIVCDLHSDDFKENPYYMSNVRLCRSGYDFPIEDEPHFFNTGVIFVRDTENTHKFYEEWNKLLREGWGKGVKMDQPSFAYTNYKMGHIAHSLDGVWNCQLCYGMRYLKDAKIVHYICTNNNRSKNKERPLYIMNDLSIYQKIKIDGVIPQEMKDVIDDPFKGLSTISLCITGDDLYYFHTVTSRHFRSLYGTRKFPYVEWTIRKYCNLKRRLSKIKRLLTKVNGGGGAESPNYQSCVHAS